MEGDLTLPIPQTSRKEGRRQSFPCGSLSFVPVIKEIASSVGAKCD